MEFWDSISKTVSEAADYTAREASKLTGMAKLKYKISTSKARLDTLFANLGQIKYNDLKGTSSSDASSYDELIANIDTLKAELEGYENELAKLKNVRVCTACRSVIAIDMAFCPRCGAKQPEPEKSEDGCDGGCCCGCESEAEVDCDCKDDDCCCDSKDEDCCCDSKDEDCCCECDCEDDADNSCECDDGDCGCCCGEIER